MIGNVNLTLRPIRLGFLINPKDARAIRLAIQISSLLWGGALNPLIPVFKRNKPATWKRSLSPKDTTQDITIGYLDAFDPDVLIRFSEDIPPYIMEYGLEIIKPEDITASFIKSNGREGPSYGVGILEILDQIYDEHFRYSDKYKPRIVIPKLPASNTLFWAAFLGELPDYALRVIQQGYKEELEIDDSPFHPTELKSILSPSTLFTRRLSLHELDTHRRRSRVMRDHAVFVLDARKPEDVLDYWNLRATGRTIFPFPTQLQDTPEIREIVSDFIKSTVRLVNPEQNLYSHASFISSRNVQKEEMEAIARGLDLERIPDGDGTRLPYTFQNWYPRIWDEWARSYDGVEVDDVYSAHKTVTLGGTQDSVSAEPLSPEFLSDRAFTGKPRYANEVKFRIYGYDEPVMPAEVFPKTNGSKMKEALIGPLFNEECRVGRNGPVILEKWEAARTWKVLSGQDIFFAWLADHGLEAQLSQPGIFAREIQAQLQGSIYTLADKDLLKLLERMNSGPDGDRPLPVAEIKNRLGGMSDFLVSKNVFRIGPRVQCPYCNRRTWYNLEDVKEQMTCPRCLRNYPAVEHLSKSVWCYKTAGPFSIHDYAGGAYAVLLSVNFFNERRVALEFKKTAAYSFEAKSDSGESLEADFGLLWEERTLGGTMSGVAFGECKTFNTFEQRDFSRMRLLATKFPGAVIAFCTLRESLTNREIREIKRIAKMGRKYWKNERPLNPVLILTGNELLGRYYPAPPSWEAAGVASRYAPHKGLLHVCSITQQVYLNLQPWENEWHEGFEKKRARRAAQIKQTPAPSVSASN
jgi:hypothetical protein